MYEPQGKEEEGVIEKVSKKVENCPELCRGPEGQRANGNKETPGGSAWITATSLL